MSGEASASGHQAGGEVYSLLLAQGIYAQFFQAVLLRELVTRFGGLELSFVIAISVALLWTALGCAFAGNFLKAGSTQALGAASLLAILTPLTAVGTLAISAIAPPLLGSGIEELLLFCFLAPLPFGLLNGAICGLLVSFVPKEQGSSCYSTAALGSVLGGTAFSFALAQSASPLLVLGSFGVVLPLMAGISAWRMSLPVAIKVFMSLLALIALGLSWRASQSDLELSSWKWAKLQPGYSFERSVETASGRIDFLQSLPRDRETVKPFAAPDPDARLKILRDGLPHLELPFDSALYCPAALFSVLQPNRSNLSILLVASPFSPLPGIIAGFPVTERLDFISADAGLLSLSRGLGILPAESDTFSVLNVEPRSYIERPLDKESTTYDLIIVVDMKPETIAGNRFFTHEFFRAATARLRPGGVLVSSVSSVSPGSDPAAQSMNSALLRTLRLSFPRIITAPSEIGLIAAGGLNLSADLSVLDRRLARYFKESDGFPDSFFSILFSQAQQLREYQALASAEATARIDRDLHPAQPFLALRHHSSFLSGAAAPLIGLFSWLAGQWVLVSCLGLAAYLFLRFLLSRKMDFRLLFSSFENGFYAMGIALLLLLVYQCKSASLYRDIPLALGLFIGGAALGAWGRGRSKSCERLIRFFAFLMPLAVPLLMFNPIPALYSQIMILLLLALSGSAVGLAYGEFFSRSTVHQGAWLWGMELAGGSAACLILTLFLIPAGGAVPCMILLSLMRLPLLLGRFV